MTLGICLQHKCSCRYLQLCVVGSPIFHCITLYYRHLYTFLSSSCRHFPKYRWLFYDPNRADMPINRCCRSICVTVLLLRCMSSRHGATPLVSALRKTFQVSRMTTVLSCMLQDPGETVDKSKHVAILECFACLFIKCRNCTNGPKKSVFQIPYEGKVFLLCLIW